MENEIKDEKVDETVESEKVDETEKVENEIPDENQEQQTETSIINDVIKKVESLRTEIIDYIDLKFSNLDKPVEKDDETSSEQETDEIW